MSDVAFRTELFAAVGVRAIRFFLAYGFGAVLLYGAWLMAEPRLGYLSGEECYFGRALGLGPLDICYGYWILSLIVLLILVGFMWNALREAGLILSNALFVFSASLSDLDTVRSQYPSLSREDFIGFEIVGGRLGDPAYNIFGYYGHKMAFLRTVARIAFLLAIYALIARPVTDAARRADVPGALTWLFYFPARWAAEQWKPVENIVCWEWLVHDNCGTPEVSTTKEPKRHAPISPVRGNAPISTVDGSEEAIAGSGLSAPIHASVSRTGPAVSPSHPQRIAGDWLADYDYGIRLRRPSSDWQFLDREAPLMMNNPDAFMGLRSPGKHMWFIASGERMEGASLADYAEFALKTTAFFQPSGPARRSQIEIGGYPGVLLVQSGSFQGGDLTMAFRVVNRDGFVYNLTGWAATSVYPEAANAFSAIAESVRFDQDHQPRVPQPPQSPDDQGVDWRISDNVYANAAFGFALTPRSGFRLAGRVELLTSFPDAAAALIASRSRFRQSYFVVALGDINPDTLIKTWVDQYRHELGITAPLDHITEVRIGGLPATEYQVRDVSVNGMTLDLRLAFFIRDNLLFSVVSEWPSSERAASVPLVGESYTLLTWLDDVRRAQLAAELALADVNNMVGPEYAYRNGVLRDFEVGYSLTTPPGLWHASTGDALAQQDTNARLHLYLPSEGVELLVIPELLEMEHDAYHSVLLAGRSPHGDVFTETRQHGDIELKVSAFSETLDGMPYSLRLITAVRGQRHLQLWLLSLRGSEHHLKQRLPEIIAGLDFPATMPVKIEQRESEIIDHRLGFKLSLRDAQRFREVIPPHGAAGLTGFGTVLTSNQREGLVDVIASCSPRGFDVDGAVQAMIRVMGVRVDPGSPTKTDTELAGRPAQRISVTGTRQGADASFDVWVIKRANSFYFLTVVGDEGGSVDRQRERLSSAFQLID